MAQEEHRSTSRVLDILEALASADERGYTLSELAELAHAPKSSLFPIVHTLRRRRFLALGPGGRYTIGLGAFAVGSAFLDSQSLYGHIKQIMAGVVSACSEICQLGIRDRDQVLYVAKVDSSESVRLISHIGKRLPLYSTALGKALVLDFTPERLASLFPDTMRRLTPRTVCSVEELAKQLACFRETGVTEECGESAEGIQCYAVPLLRTGRTEAALSVSIPTFRITPEKVRLVREKLTEAKAGIEALLQESGAELDFFSFLDGDTDSGR